MLAPTPKLSRSLYPLPQLSYMQVDSAIEDLYWRHREALALCKLDATLIEQLRQWRAAARIQRVARGAAARRAAAALKHIKLLEAMAKFERRKGTSEERIRRWLRVRVARWQAVLVAART